MTETVILCEGYHDRAFWKGWLTHLSCSDPGLPAPGKKARGKVLDPWNAPVVRGQFAYRSKSTQFIRVVPCGGKDGILPMAQDRLSDIPTRALTRLALVVDPDVPTASAPSTTTGLLLHHVEHMVRGFDPAAKTNVDGEIELHGGTTRIGLVRWETPDPPGAGLPDEQTLERLVCAVLTAAYPGRGKAVQDWLDGRPDKPPVNPKDHSWSFMAGWYADHGCEDFFTNLWRDPVVVTHLEARLRHSGARQLAERLTQ